MRLTRVCVDVWVDRHCVLPVVHAQTAVADARLSLLPHGRVQSARECRTVIVWYAMRCSAHHSPLES